MIFFDSTEIDRRTPGYSVQFSGNEGENGISFTGVLRQGRSCSFVVLHATVDGMVEVVEEYDGGYENLDVFFMKHLIRWVKGGIPPTEDQFEQLVEQVNEATNSLLEFWGFEPKDNRIKIKWAWG